MSGWGFWGFLFRLAFAIVGAVQDFSHRLGRLVTRKGAK